MGGLVFSKTTFLAALLLLALPLAGHAVTLQVNCDQPTSKLPTIGAALKIMNGLVGDLGPNTINVTGACNENISLDHITNLPLSAQNGASITDASAGTMPV